MNERLYNTLADLCSSYEHAGVLDSLSDIIEGAVIDGYMFEREEAASMQRKLNFITRLINENTKI